MPTEVNEIKVGMDDTPESELVASLVKRGDWRFLISSEVNRDSCSPLNNCETL